MREVRNITVAVTPELYRQTRKLAAEVDGTVSSMVAYLLERMPSVLKSAGYKVTVPPGAPYHVPRKATANPRIPNLEVCAQCAHTTAPTPSPKNANSACTAVKPSQLSDPSVTSLAHPNADTAQVRQYESANPNTAKDLSEKPGSADSRCTPVWGKWFRRITPGNK